jgi:hypothetical protein
MSRLFDGVDDLMTYGSLTSTPTGALTLLILLKVAVAADNTWLSFIEIQQNATGRVAIGRENSATGHIYISGSSVQYYNAADGAITDADGWTIVAVTKAAGTATPRIHKMVIGGSAFHNNAGGTINNPASGNQLFLGGNDDFANIYVGAAAYWNSELTDGQLNGIHSAKTTQSILDLTPIWCVDDGNGDGLATDRAGTKNRTALTGTTDSADDPSGWVYFGEGGAAAPSRSYRRRDPAYLLAR